MRPSSEAETRSRGRPALDRDGTSLEGGVQPSRRRNLTRGGDQPSSEAEVLPARHHVPRVKRGSARGWSRVAGPLGPLGSWAREFILRAF
jgi:hypothetical protein